MTGTDDLSALRKEPFSNAVAKFEDLLVQNDAAFLIGAGCSKCTGLPLTAELATQVLAGAELNDTSKAILRAIADLFGGAKNAHIEDYLSELVDLLAIAGRRSERGATQREIVLDSESYSADQLLDAVKQIKRAIACIIEKKIPLEIHRAFVRAIHRRGRVGKNSASDPVHYLVLNYDTCIEDALALEKISYSDGIDGGRTGWWNPTTFERDRLASHVLKLHGSIDWWELSDDPLPRRIAPSIEVATAIDRRILIWPASTKYRETQFDPYAQLAERARQVLRPTIGVQRVLVICGYSYSDTHINSELYRALRESSGDLTVIAFTSEDTPHGILEAWTEDERIRQQVLVFANRGFFHGDTRDESMEDLRWWKFENITRLIEGER